MVPPPLNLSLHVLHFSMTASPKSNNPSPTKPLEFRRAVERLEERHGHSTFQALTHKFAKAIKRKPTIPNNNNNIMCISRAFESVPQPITMVSNSKPNRRRSRPVSPEGHQHLIVHHNYHDHAHDVPSLSYLEQAHPYHCPESAAFPIKLQEMLDRVEADGFSDIISWQPHGRCFIIHQPKEFTSSDLLPRYNFGKITKLASFQRQLNLYGFQRITQGLDKGAYYHELFLRNRSFLAHQIQRIKVKGTGVRAKSNPEEEPDLWAMEWVGTTAMMNNNVNSTVPATSSGAIPMVIPASPAPSVSSLSLDSQDTPLLMEWGQPFYALDSLPEEIAPAKQVAVETERPLNLEFEQVLDHDQVLNSMLEQMGDDLVDLLEVTVAPTMVV